MARGYEFTILTEEWTVIDGKEHTHGRLINFNRNKCLRKFGIGNRVADLKSFKAHNGYNFTGSDRSFDFLFSQSFKEVQFLDLLFLYQSVLFYEGYPLADLHRSTEQTSDSDTANIGGVVKGGNHHLRRAFNEGRCR